MNESVNYVDKLAEIEIPYPTDVVNKKGEPIKTNGKKPFNHAKIDKYRRIWAQGYRKAKETYQNK